MGALPILVANIAAAIIFIVLLLPGVLNGETINAQAAAAMAERMEHNAQLDQEIARLKQEAESAACVGDGQPAAQGEQPGNQPGDQPAGQEDVASTGNPKEPPSLPGPALPASKPPAPVIPIPALPKIEPLNPKEAIVENDGENLPLVDLLERSVVMVVVQGGEGQNPSLGTGFLIDANNVVTNQHVVGEAGEALIVNKHLGRIVAGQVVARTDGPAEKGELDLAVLQMSESPSELTPLRIAKNGRKMQPVISAGFPGFLLKVDSDFRRLQEGDLSAAPEMIMNSGRVRRPGQESAPVPFILHSAEIAQGNSGGPLVDACGQVLGVNTLIQDGTEQSYRTSWALTGEALLGFLATKGMSAVPAETACYPQNPGKDESASRPSDTAPPKEP